MWALGQSQKPSWCLQVRIIPRIPALFRAWAHWPASRQTGSNRAGLACPGGHRHKLRLAGAAQTEHPHQGRHAGRSRGVQPEGRGIFHPVVGGGAGRGETFGPLPAEPVELGAGVPALPEGGALPGRQPARAEVEELLGPVGPAVRGAEDVRPHQQPRLEKDQLPLHRRALSQIPQVPPGEAVRQRGEARQGRQGLGDGPPLPGAAVAGEAGAVHPEGIVGGGAFQGAAQPAVHVGAPAGVGQDGLPAVVHIHVEQVRVAVAAAQAAGAEMDPGILPAPAGAEDVVAAGLQLLGGAVGPGRRQGRQPGRSVGAEVPQRLFAEGPLGRGGQQRVPEQQGPRRQQIPGVDDVAVPLGQDGAVRGGPDRQGPAHGPGFFRQKGRDGDPVALRQKQSVQQGVEHLAVVHGALLPLDAVGQDGMAEVLLQAAEGPQPVFGAQAGFQRTPGGAFAGGGAGHPVQPVPQQGNKGVEIAGLAGVLPGPAQMDEDGVPVEGVGPLGIPGGDGVPDDGAVKMDGLAGGLHLPVVPEQEGVPADLPGASQSVRSGLRAELPDRLRRFRAAGPEHRSCVHTRSPLSISHFRTKRPQGRASSRQTASAVPAITAQRTNTAPQPKPSAAAPMPQVVRAAPR